MIAWSVGQRHPPNGGTDMGLGYLRGVFAQHLRYWFQYRGRSREQWGWRRHLRPQGARRTGAHHWMRVNPERNLS